MILAVDHERCGSRLCERWTTASICVERSLGCRLCKIDENAFAYSGRIPTKQDNSRSKTGRQQTFNVGQCSADKV